MNYVYVQDIVDEFLDIYIEPKRVYNTILGKVVDFITEFKENIDNKNYVVKNSEFKQKLFNTYLDYRKNNV